MNSQDYNLNKKPKTPIILLKMSSLHNAYVQAIAWLHSHTKCGMTAVTHYYKIPNGIVHSSFCWELFFLNPIGLSSSFQFVLLTLLFVLIFNLHCGLSRLYVSRKGPVKYQITWLEGLVSQFLLSRNRDFIFNFTYYLGLLSRNRSVSSTGEKRVTRR